MPAPGIQPNKKVGSRPLDRTASFKQALSINRDTREGKGIRLASLGGGLSASSLTSPR